jgi:hypothetical protein
MPRKKKAKKYENVIGFDEIGHFRILSDEKLKMQKVIRQNQDIYYNESHFIRCAIIKILKEYDSHGRINNKI